MARLREIGVGANPRTLAQDSAGRIWVANQDDATLSILDGETFSVLRTLALPRASRPYGVCFDPEGGTAYVTLEGTGRLLRFNADDFTQTGDIAVVPSARAIAFPPDGSKILVTRYLSEGLEGEIAVVATDAFVRTGAWTVAYEGIPDQLPGGVWGAPNALTAIAITPDGKRAWIPFVKDNVLLGLFRNPEAATPGFESTVRTAVAQFDLETGEEIRDLRSDFVELSMVDAAVVDGAGAFAYLSSQTGNAVAVFDAVSGKMRLRFDPEDPEQGLAPDGMVLDSADSLLFIHYFLGRSVGAYDVSRIAGSDSIRRAAFMPTVDREVLAPEILRGKRIFYNAADARMSLHRYISCAVCHLEGASDQRVWDFTHKGEGLRRTASLLGRSGMGHGPLHWSANFDEVQDFELDMRVDFAGTGFIEGFVPDPHDRYAALREPLAGRSPDLDALADYVGSLTKARPSPYRSADGSLTAEAKEGEAIFLDPEVGCAVCHPPPRFTDSGPPRNESTAAAFVPIRPPDSIHGDFQPSRDRVVRKTGSVEASSVYPVQPGTVLSNPGGFVLHDVGTLHTGSGSRMGDSLPGLDTPSLLGIWESGPYLHDGSAATLMDVITKANPDDRHGRTSHLTDTQRKQLVAYLRQIEGTEPGTSFKPERSLPGLRTLIQRRGDELRVPWHSSLSGKHPVIAVYDLSGKRVARLHPVGEANAESGFRFHWKSDAAGIFQYRLSW